MSRLKRTLDVNQIRAIVLLALSFWVNAFAAPPVAGSPDVVGTWTLVRVDNLMPDGTRIELYGAGPQGLLMFDAHGRYSLQILRAGRSKFASNDKAKGTPQEYADAVRGSNAHFGRYTVNAADKSITFHIEHASYPNWEGTKQTRSFVLDHDSLTYSVPTPTSGGNAIGEVEWRRAESD
jgi:hypothetical protein